MGSVKLRVSIHQDGENTPEGLDSIKSSWQETWDRCYGSQATLSFEQGKNLKETSGHSSLLALVKEIINIRNPDLFFIEEENAIAIGGVEITAHSPDGSNVEKRYPFLWISQGRGIHALTASPYLKVRPGKRQQINKLPHRHSHRNAQFLEEWQPRTDENTSLCQIVPVRDLHGAEFKHIPANIQKLMPSWSDIGVFFCHALAMKVLTGEARDQAKIALETFRSRLRDLAKECMANTRDTEAASLLKLPDRWIQVYNSRPDSGHWERGEGQFDSIDGRLMFTLDEISRLPVEKRPSRLEFWLPQMAAGHPWIVEQQQRGYGSKRFRNIVVILKKLCPTKFADDLNADEWSLLQANSRMLLEREDWKPGLYKVTEVVPEKRRAAIASGGLKNAPKPLIENLTSLLSDDTLFFSAHRAYLKDWQSDLARTLASLPADAQVLVPRIPKCLLKGIASGNPIRIYAAEDCTKDHLLMLRQIHRTLKATIPEFRASK